MAPPIFSVKRGGPGDSDLSRTEENQQIESEADLPPVVARMVVEIRSDGTRTVARGALEDLQTGEKVALMANARSPVALARELTKTLIKMPVLAGGLTKEAVLDLLPDAIRKRRRLFRSKGKD